MAVDSESLTASTFRPQSQTARKILSFVKKLEQAKGFEPSTLTLAGLQERRPPFTSPKWKLGDHSSQLGLVAFLPSNHGADRWQLRQPENRQRGSARPL